MDKLMKKIVFSVVTISFVALCAVPSSWAVTDEQFQALVNQVQTLEKEHQDDQAQIQSLKDQLGQTDQKTDEIKKTADQAAEAVSKVQPVAPTEVQPVAPALKVPAENHNFVLAGDAEVQYVKQGEGNKANGTFQFADFAPVFLFRATDKVLFEAGFDTTLSNGGVGTGGTTTNFDLTFAQIDYLFNDYLTFIGGKMLLPLGTYNERSAGWLNKISDDPLPRALLIGEGVGVQARGAVAIGESGQSITYAAYSTNGGSSIDGTGNATTSTGGNNFDTDGNVTNQHRRPSIGGRIGWFFPWKPHYDVELGLSGQSGTWDSAGKEIWDAGVIDAAIHLGPYFETKGEYIYTSEQTANIGSIAPQGWWVQSGFKLSAFNLDVPLIPNTELVFRYDTVNNALGFGTTGAAEKSFRYTPGIVYYITNTLWLEGSYEKTYNSDGVRPSDQWLAQLSYGF